MASKLIRMAGLAFLILAVITRGEPSVARSKDGITKSYPQGSNADKAQTSPFDEHHVPSPGPVMAQSLASPTDQFGYQIDDTVTFAWLDASTGTEVVFEDEWQKDDSYTDLIDIGFTFKYYENSYSQLSIGTNGFVTFVEGSDAFTNRIMPQDPPPNNLIAPFWDDLSVGDGKIYYKLINSEPKKFVIEWYQVERYGSTDLLTFEIVLYANGNIWFQYLDLNGLLTSATVGIEDGDGVDGLLYLHNSSGLVSGLAIEFIRPAASARAKAMPGYLSGFVYRRQGSFHLEVLNTGEKGSDRYNLTATSSAPGWVTTFYAADGAVPLKDTNTPPDGKVDTGPVAQGDAVSIVIKIQAPEQASLGDFTDIDLAATSSLNSSKKATALLQTAVPAAFAQAYSDSQTGMYLDMIWDNNEIFSKVSNFFTGNTMTLVMRPDGTYVYSWERNYSYDPDPADPNNPSIYYSDLEFVLLDRLGIMFLPQSKLTNNIDVATTEMNVTARYPALAATQDGKTVVMWAQYKFDLITFGSNSNIFFSILDQDGNIQDPGPVNLTENTRWRGEGDPAAPVFNNPHVEVTSDNRLFFTWIEGHELESGEQSSMYYAIYNSNGSLFKPATLFTQSEPGSTLFIDPSLTPLSEPEVLITYSIFDQITSEYSVVYALLDSAGQVVRSPTIIPGVDGWRSTAVQMTGGNLLIAWTDPTTSQITYIMYDQLGNTVITGPVALSLVGDRFPDYISITNDQAGSAVMTWMDAEWKDFLYYTLISETGQILTPPMIFATGQSENPLIQTSFSGRGIAPYGGSWRTYLPMTFDHFASDGH